MQSPTAVLLGKSSDGFQLLLQCIVWQMTHRNVPPREEAHIEAEPLHRVVQFGEEMNHVCAQ